jgi:hypothetical protein
MTSVTANSEHRQQHRLEIEGSLSVTNAKTGSSLGLLANLSVEGLMISSQKPIALNTRFHLNVPLSAEGVDDVSILVTAESLWSEDVSGSGTYWTGFHIENISAEHQEILTKIVTS